MTNILYVFIIIINMSGATRKKSPSKQVYKCFFFLQTVGTNNKDSTPGTDIKLTRRSAINTVPLAEDDAIYRTTVALHASQHVRHLEMSSILCPVASSGALPYWQLSSGSPFLKKLFRLVLVLLPCLPKTRDALSITSFVHRSESFCSSLSLFVHVFRLVLKSRNEFTVYHIACTYYYGH